MAVSCERGTNVGVEYRHGESMEKGATSRREQEGDGAEVPHRSRRAFGDHIVMFNCFDVCHKSPDSGDRQCNSGS